GQLVSVLEERLGVGEQRVLSVAHRRKRRAKRLDLGRRGSLLQELLKAGEQALLEQPIGERRILDRVEHAQQEVRQRDAIPKRGLELRDAESEAAAHRIE